MVEQFHPDADLLRAYDEWRVAKFASDAVHLDRIDSINELEDLIAKTPAHGLTGLAVKMRVILAGVMSCWVGDHIEYVVDNEPGESVKNDCYPAMLWAAIENAERLAEA